jgi:uncharacterized repeat protein (TIGR02543 family)
MNTAQRRRQLFGETVAGSYYSYSVDNAGATTPQTGGTPPGAALSGTQVVSPAVAPEKTGSTFGGWYEERADPVFSGYQTSFQFAMPARDVTVRAKWIANNYLYKVNDNSPLQASAGGTVPNERNGVQNNVSPFHAGVTVTLPTQQPTRNGYTFGGWSRSDGLPALAASAATFTMPANDITVTAIWVAPDHILEYDMNGGDTAYDTDYYDSSTQTYVPLDRIDYPHDTGDTVRVYPGMVYNTPAGAGFNGWRRYDGGTDTGLAYQPGATFTMPDANVRLAAQWQANTWIYTVSAGTATTPPSGGTPSPSTLTAGTAVTLPTTDPQKAVTGVVNNANVQQTAVFMGWEDILNGQSNALWQGFRPGGATFAMPSRQMQVNAVFGFNYTLDLNGGTGASGGDPSGVYLPLSAVALPVMNPVKTGFTFAGWKRLDTNATVAAGGIAMPGYHITVQAQWTPA